VTLIGSGEVTCTHHPLKVNGDMSETKVHSSSKFRSAMRRSTWKHLKFKGLDSNST